MEQHINSTQRPSIRAVLAALLAASLFVIGLGVAPAGADAPTTFSETVMFEDINPCTGQPMVVTLNLEISEHQDHNNNFVAHLSRTGGTSDGYVVVNGVESFVDNGNVVRGGFMDMLAHPDGSRFRVNGHFVFNIRQDELKVDKFKITCL